MKRSSPSSPALAALVVPAAAFAHADVSPPIGLEGREPGLHARRPDREGERARRRRSSSRRRPGSASTRSCRRPGWKRDVMQTGCGEDAVIRRSPGRGGNVPTGEDSRSRSSRARPRRKTYTFGVRQTYSDGSVVDWTGRSRPTRPPRRSRRSPRSAAAARARRSRSSRWSSGQSASSSASSRCSPAGGARSREARRSSPVVAAAGALIAAGGRLRPRALCAPCRRRAAP